jgi:hypothetical protein
LLSAEEIFGECEEVAKILQSVQLTAKAALESVEMLKKTLLTFRADKKFEELKMKTDEKTAEYGLKTPERRQLLATPAAIQHNNCISTEDRRSNSQRLKTTAKRHFSSSASRAWNRLPCEVTEVNSTRSFKAAATKFYFSFTK